jgi:hypothetical protein
MTDKHRLNDEQLGKELESLISGNVESVTPPAGTFLAIQDRLGEQDRGLPVVGFIVDSLRLPMSLNTLGKNLAILVLAILFVAVLFWQGRDTDQGVQPANEAIETAVPEIEDFQDTTDTDIEPVVGEWVKGSPPPLTGRIRGMMALSDGRIFVFEPFGNAGSAVYDSARDEWSAMGKMPSFFTGGDSAELRDGRVIFFANSSSRTWLFDPSNGNWSEGPPRPSTTPTRRALTMADGRVLMIKNGDYEFDEVYDPETNSFDLIPGAYRAGVVIDMNGEGLDIGQGRIMFGSVDGAWIFDSIAGTWHETTKPLEPKFYAALSLLPDRQVLYSEGAGMGDPGTNYDEVYDIDSDTWSRWEPKSLLDPDLGTTVSWVVDDTGAVFCQFESLSDTTALAQLGYYDPVLNEWTMYPLPPGVTLQRGQFDKFIRLPGRRVMALSREGLRVDSDAELSTWILQLPEPGRRVGSDPQSHSVPEPVVGEWAQLAAPPFEVTRIEPIVLDDGRVFIHENTGSRSMRTAIYDFETNAWELQGDQNHPSGTTVLLDDGRVMGLGYGFTPSKRVQFFDPATGEWVMGDPMREEGLLGAVSLDDGRVLVMTHVREDGAMADMFDPATDSWKPVEPPGSQGSFNVVELQDGRVFFGPGPEDTIFDPDTETWSAASPLEVDSGFDTGSLLNDGTVLAHMHGGQNETERWTDWTSDLYDPVTDNWSKWEPVYLLDDHDHLHVYAVLEDGSVVGEVLHINEDPTQAEPPDIGVFSSSANEWTMYPHPPADRGVKVLNLGDRTLLAFEHGVDPSMWVMKLP